MAQRTPDLDRWLAEGRKLVSQLELSRGAQTRPLMGA